MGQRRAILKVIAGPHHGDTVRIEMGVCRLLGRHLSDHETALMDPDGNRILDAAASEILAEHLKAHSPHPITPVAAVQNHRSDGSPSSHGAAFERGPDVIFADDAISRAHAMVFHESSGVGIVDLASTNGTYINNQVILSSLVKDGDIISLGSSKLLVQIRI